MKEWGGNVQGNYQAIFDFVSKGIFFLISPLTTALFPILTNAYSAGNRQRAKNLLKRILVYEILFCVAVTSAYWLGGEMILFRMLRVPYNWTYRFMGFLVVLGTFIWQFAILIQKRLELRLETLGMLGMVIALLVQVTFFLVFQSSFNQLLYPLGYVISSSTYLLLVSLPYFKSLETPIHEIVIKYFRTSVQVLNTTLNNMIQ